MTIERPMFPPHGGCVDRRAVLVAIPFVAAAPSLAAALPASDPIMAVIDRHRAFRAEWLVTFTDRVRLEKELPEDRRRSFFTAGHQNTITTDDPLWIDLEFRTYQNCQGMMEAAKDLATVRPTTITGLLALLAYVALIEEEEYGGEAWPDDKWSCRLHANLAESAKSIAGGSR